MSKYKELYDKMSVKLDELGCIMLDTDPIKVSDIIDADDLYYTPNKNLFWIDGIVSEKVPHVTVLYGLMNSGQLWKEYVDTVLEGWNIKTVEISHVNYFDSAYEEEPYYCIVAELLVTEKLLEGNSRLRLLPHIDTYANYRPHITLAYIKNDKAKRDKYVAELGDMLAGKRIKVKGVNYGG